MSRLKLLPLVLVLAVVCAAALPQQQRKGRKRQPRRTTAVDKRVYLVHADVLHYDQYSNRDAQILNGHVHFTHAGARLYCDSAYFYEQTNSFEAFGHVKMYQGDTL